MKSYGPGLQSHVSHAGDPSQDPNAKGGAEAQVEVAHHHVYGVARLQAQLLEDDGELLPRDEGLGGGEDVAVDLVVEPLPVAALVDYLLDLGSRGRKVAI